ncbi:MAG: NUDIX domain-containing protein, partial [Candidatus Daviesbacteria bacterium]|nr:NUDIX domain-containing protein [Candidatus Daviesbacteria bacterium]
MKLQFSAGGIVYKKENGEIFILVSQHSQHHGWVFPKGLIDEGETKEATAIREVKEEAGVDGKIT